MYGQPGGLPISKQLHIKWICRQSRTFMLTDASIVFIILSHANDVDLKVVNYLFGSRASSFYNFFVLIIVI